MGVPNESAMSEEVPSKLADNMSSMEWSSDTLDAATPSFGLSAMSRTLVSEPHTLQSSRSDPSFGEYTKSDRDRSQSSPKTETLQPYEQKQRAYTDSQME